MFVSKVSQEYPEAPFSDINNRKKTIYDIPYMKIAVIGTGYVGLVSGVCLADLGHRVICIDTDKDKISKLDEGQIPIYEPGLKELVDSNVKVERLSFSTNLIDYIDVADAVMIAVGTPMSDNGSTDLKYVMEVADEIAFGVNETEREDDLLVIMKSTVPAGTNDKIRDRILSKLDKGKRHLLHMASNPEFLKEGTAVNDFKHPDRIVIGYSDGYAKRLMTELYCPEGNDEFADKLFFTVNIKSAELIKYASNCMLMSKVIFIDLIAKYCEAIGADVEDVAAGMGLDKRIGPAFLKAGPGTSGSCFIKDSKSLIYEFDSVGIKNRLLEGVDKENRLMYDWPADTLSRIRDRRQDFKPLTPLTIGILGTAFKADTDDVRYSAALYNTAYFVSKGYTVKHYDPKATDNFLKSLPDYMDPSEDLSDEYIRDHIVTCSRAEDVFDDADAVILMTDWDEFRELNMENLVRRMANNVFIDARNQFNGYDMVRYGFDYYGIGKGI